ncbi:MAG: radical SAM protein [Promethearchaeota archaeon]
MKYVYGPVPSRRLGNSLGIDPLPLKTCNYQCIYCQLGRTTNFTNIRKNFYPRKEIIMEMEKAFELHENTIDYITFVGSGEPTLYKDLKELIKRAKEISDKPVCVITNGSLLIQKAVQQSLLNSDLIIPSFDAGDNIQFKKINRPHPSIHFKDLIRGLINFKKIFKGDLWIEVMVMKGINDSKEHLLKIKKYLDLINPNRIDINVPIRPPFEKWVKIPDDSITTVLDEVFEDYSNINYPEKGKFKIYSTNFEKEILSILERHPMRQNQIIETFSSSENNIDRIITKLEELRTKDKIMKVVYNKQIFWKIKTDRN